jgi:hypothetical protein
VTRGPQKISGTQAALAMTGIRGEVLLGPGGRGWKLSGRVVPASLQRLEHGTGLGHPGPKGEWGLPRL